VLKLPSTLVPQAVAKPRRIRLDTNIRDTATPAKVYSRGFEVGKGRDSFYCPTDMRVDPGRGKTSARPSARAWLGLVLSAAGALLLGVGWYDVSGETLVARQLPFVASASMPGAALLIAGAVVIGNEISRRGSEQAEAMMTAVYRLLTEELPSDNTEGASDDAGAKRAVAVANGTRYHRSACLMIEGKAGVRVVDDTEIQQRGLQPCPVCAPPLVGA
jgi:hypothetical protein